MKRPPKESPWVAVAAITLLVLVLVAIEVGACLYARWLYGDWKCGLPGAQCRRVRP